MESEITKATIANWALVQKLGLPASFSIDDETEVGGILDQVWQPCVDECFGLHDWTFCRRTSKLTRKEGQPVTGYAYAFDLPGDRIGDPLKVARDPRCTVAVRDYHLEGFELHANEKDIYVRCRVHVNPSHWDPAFRAAFVTALGSYLAVPMLHDTDMRDSLRGQAFGTPSQGGTGGQFGRLIAQNRAASPMGSPFEGSDPLVDARWT